MSHKRLLLISGLALLFTSFSQSPVVPLYDGVGFPDEPYRYVNPPSSLPPTQKPTEASGASTVQDGVNSQLLFPSTSEQAPQASLYVPRHSLKAPSTAHNITLHVSPLAPIVHPIGATIVGNVYGLLADSDSGLVSPNGAAPIGTIALRLPQNTMGDPAIYYRAPKANSWQALKTIRIGNDIYQADLIGLGEYALAIPSNNSMALASKSMAKTPPKTQNNLFSLSVIVVGTVIVIGIIIFIIRKSNRRSF
jgi:hypothetical protein